MKPEFLLPDWPAPTNVHALVTTRKGGVSGAPWDSFNLGDHVGDDVAAVTENRRRLNQHLPAEPVWLTQVHGSTCLDAQHAAGNRIADAAFTHASGVVCAVLTADCLPVLFCDDAGTTVAAAHAGWRGLAAGVLESTVRAMGIPAERLLAWMGPAIGPQNFEVGAEVRAAFVSQNAQTEAAFRALADHKWLCDILQLARQRLEMLGLRRIASADFCTVRDREYFYSYRREGVTGRMASLIWLS